MILDVGCGMDPTGDVNCDLFLKDVGHRSVNKIFHLNPQAIPNFIKCDALHLPFKKSCFNEVRCEHVLAHVESPERLILELLRVSKFKVVVSAPHALGEFKYDVHIHNFRGRWFYQLAKKHGLAVKVTFVRWHNYPCEAITFFRLPCEIKAVFYKEYRKK